MAKPSGPDFEKTLSDFGKCTDHLRSIIADDTFHGVISATEAQEMANELGKTIPQFALILVDIAQYYAVVPVSNFHVGAVGVGSSGALYFGANLEVSGAALSFTLHAEQSATSNAWINGEQGLAYLAISAAPCGYCRQFLYELVDAAQLQIVLPKTGDQLLTYFLPDPFGPHDLGVNGGLMQNQANGLTLPGSPDEATLAALAAANASYSPYTKTFAGIALATSDGTICTGRYAENAAFNPSLSPLEAALSQLVLYGYEFGDIARAVLVEAQGPASQVSATQAVLGCVSEAQLETFTAN